MKRSALLLGSVLVAATGGAAFAATPNVEASMLVTGTITVNPQGRVQSYTLQDSDKLPPAVQHIIQTTTSRWQFVPINVDGKAVTVETGMSLRIVADVLDAQHATIRIAGAAFGCDARPDSNLPGECPAGTTIRYVRRPSPHYPIEAVQAHVGGEVFLVLQVGRDGHVSQAAVRQVNLYARTESPDQYRRMLANAALRAAHKGIFRVPTAGPDVSRDHWIVQVPINYTIGFPAPAITGYGQWNAYFPGPMQDIPWDHQETSGASSTSGDAIANGGLFVRDTRFVLKTALADGSSRS